MNLRKPTVLNWSMTEDAAAVWSLDIPYCRGKKEVFQPEGKVRTWSRQFRLSDLTKIAIRRRLTTKRNPVISVVVPASGRTGSGRVKLIAVQLADESWLNLKASVLKKMTGRLPSTLYVLSVDRPGLIKVTGTGSGHGVGMSQMGAARLAADKEWSYDRILEFYYTGTQICSIAGRKKATKAGLTSCYDPKLLENQPLAGES